MKKLSFFFDDLKMSTEVDNPSNDFPHVHFSRLVNLKMVLPFNSPGESLQVEDIRVPTVQARNPFINFQ